MKLYTNSQKVAIHLVIHPDSALSRAYENGKVAKCGRNGKEDDHDRKRNDVPSIGGR